MSHQKNDTQDENESQVIFEAMAGLMRSRKTTDVLI
jgi:hypothetical protein